VISRYRPTSSKLSGGSTYQRRYANRRSPPGDDDRTGEFELMRIGPARGEPSRRQEEAFLDFLDRRDEVCNGDDPRPRLHEGLQPPGNRGHLLFPPGTVARLKNFFRVRSAAGEMGWDERRPKNAIGAFKSSKKRVISKR
jgi:hypothetical protein